MSDVELHRRSYLDWSSEGRAGVGRYLLGAAVCAALLFGIGGIPAIVFVGDPRNFPDDPIRISLSVILSFPLILIGVLLLVRFLHRRPSWSVLSPHRPGREAVVRIAVGLAIGLGTIVATYLVFAALGVIGLEVNRSLDLILFVQMLAIALIGIPVQTAAEEVVFRGYSASFSGGSRLPRG